MGSTLANVTHYVVEATDVLARCRGDLEDVRAINTEVASGLARLRTMLDSATSLQPRSARGKRGPRRSRRK